MPLDLVLSLSVYAFVSSITPGPNNAMLLASGVNYGFIRTTPHLLGVTLGFTVMVFAVGAGLGALFMAFPVIHAILRWLGAAYLLYFAWRIAHSRAMDETTANARPLSFLEAAAFQWINPKCWVMATGAIATYAPAQANLSVIIEVAVIFGAVNGPCVASWALFGASLQQRLKNPAHLRAFNLTMAALLVASLFGLFI